MPDVFHAADATGDDQRIAAFDTSALEERQHHVELEARAGKDRDECDVGMLARDLRQVERQADAHATLHDGDQFAALQVPVGQTRSSGEGCEHAGSAGRNWF